MIPVYVINLRRSADRREWMEQELARADVVAEFVGAVDGRRFAERCSGKLGHVGRLSRAEAALVLSHRKIWRKLLASEDSYAAILEDDVHLGANFRDVLDFDWDRFSFDAVKLETLNHVVWLERRGVRIGDRELRRLGAEHLASAAYLVSRTGARKLMEDTRVLSAPVDQPLFGRKAIFSGRIQALQLFPAVAIQDNLLPDPAHRRELPTTLHETDRARIVEETRRNKPRGLLRFAREAQRLWQQAVMWGSLAPTMRKQRVPWH